MGLRTMRCDRCGELETALFRAGPLGEGHAPWWCEMCMTEAGSYNSELAEIVRMMKTVNNNDKQRRKETGDD